MASFDLVSKIDEMELQNALKNTEKQIIGRFDFKGSDAMADYKEDENVIEISAEDDYKLITWKKAKKENDSNSYLWL